MKSFAARGLVFVACLGVVSIGAGCTPRTLLTAPNTPTPLTESELASCQLRYVQSEGYLGSACESVGHLELRDTGFTIICSEQSNRERVRKAACELGANTVVLTRLNNPMLACVEIDAAFFDCQGNLGRLEEDEVAEPEETEGPEPGAD